jgi:hypothetical protein
VTTRPAGYPSGGVSPAITERYSNLLLTTAKQTTLTSLLGVVFHADTHRYNSATYYTHYQLFITPSTECIDVGECTIYVTFNANQATDLAGNVQGVASNTYDQYFDANPPLPVITSDDFSPGVNNYEGLMSTSPITITVTWSEDVTGFVVGDMVALTGTVSATTASNPNTPSPPPAAARAPLPQTSVALSVSPDLRWLSGGLQSTLVAGLCGLVSCGAASNGGGGTGECRWGTSRTRRRSYTRWKWRPQRTGVSRSTCRRISARTPMRFSTLRKSSNRCPHPTRCCGVGASRGRVDTAACSLVYSLLGG